MSSALHSAAFFRGGRNEASLAAAVFSSRSPYGQYKVTGRALVHTSTSPCWFIKCPPYTLLRSPPEVGETAINAAYEALRAPFASGCLGCETRKT
jgi:hypothetical protein